MDFLTFYATVVNDFYELAHRLDTGEIDVRILAAMVACDHKEISSRMRTV